MSDVWQVANHSGENLVTRRSRTTSSFRRYPSVFSKQHGGLSDEGEVRRRKVLHFLNQGYHFREAYAGDKTQLLATYLPQTFVYVIATKTVT